MINSRIQSECPIGLQDIATYNNVLFDTRDGFIEITFINPYERTKSRYSQVAH